MATPQGPEDQPGGAEERYGFGDFVLDVSDRRLMRGAQPVHLMPKTFDVLVALVSRSGRLVTKRELLDRVWPQVFVDEGILTVHAALRKALGDTRRPSTHIETVSRLDYRFVAAGSYRTTTPTSERQRPGRREDEAPF